MVNFMPISYGQGSFSTSGRILFFVRLDCVTVVLKLRDTAVGLLVTHEAVIYLSG